MKENTMKKFIAILSLFILPFRLQSVLLPAEILRYRGLPYR
jgi:hypothetical protein